MSLQLIVKFRLSSTSAQVRFYNTALYFDTWAEFVINILF